MTTSAQWKAQQAAREARRAPTVTIGVTAEELQFIIAGLGLESARLIKFLHGSHGKRLQAEGRRTLLLRQGACDDLKSRLMDIARRGGKAVRARAVGSGFSTWRVSEAAREAGAEVVDPTEEQTP
jgi:hypothetical protein